MTEFLVKNNYFFFEVLETGVCNNKNILSCGERFNYSAIATNNYITNNCTGDVGTRLFSATGQCTTTGSTSVKLECTATHIAEQHFDNLNCSGTPIRTSESPIVCRNSSTNSRLYSCYPDGFGSEEPKLSLLPSTSPRPFASPSKSPGGSNSKAPKISAITPIVSIASSMIINWIGLVLIVATIWIQ